MNPKVAPLFESIRSVILGKDEPIILTLTALLARGHVLVEDAPGLGKTILARALAQSVAAHFQRIQFTPDLLPSDVTGVSIYHPRRETFEFAPGPVFSEVLLADEINRTSPRTQSSLLEAMEERQVSIEGKSRPLPDLFFVMATQNPIELQGTYPLPEAQLDRFLMQVSLGYPARQDEEKILAAQLGDHPIGSVTEVTNAEGVLALQDAVRTVHVSEDLRNYIVRIAEATRKHPEIRLGLSPRGSLALMHAARAHAFVLGEDYVTPDTVKAVAVPVIRHRLLIDDHKIHTGVSASAIVEEILDRTEVPVRGDEEEASGSRPAQVGARVGDDGTP